MLDHLSVSLHTDGQTDGFIIAKMQVSYADGRTNYTLIQAYTVLNTGNIKTKCKT